MDYTEEDPNELPWHIIESLLSLSPYSFINPKYITVMSNSTTRCKFSCVSVEHFEGSRQVKLSALYSNNRPEDNQFSSATPSGQLSMVLTNPETLDFFKPGKAYFLDISEVPA